MFNAPVALAETQYTRCREESIHQDKLDIAEKTRTSVLPWRGQFSPQLIDYLIESNAPKAKLVVDPFCGSGTVLYEAAAHGLPVVAYDINPAAICLAEFGSICSVEKQERFRVVGEIRLALPSLIAISDELSVGEATDWLSKRSLSNHAKRAIKALLLLAFGNQKTASKKKFDKAGKTVESAMLSAPFSNRTVSAQIADARELAIEDGEADYIVTSPPYINVFNYHQNYRPITESLGYTPLPMARAEIGANRKYRQNRYMTVVQYGIDMSLFFHEAGRILSDAGKMTIVLGRESNVRGVAFRNGEIIAAIAREGLGWNMQSWHERKFMNRFGETIFEDVLTLSPAMRPTSINCEDVGRDVGREALRLALSYAPKDRQREIEEAIASADQIPASPYVLRGGA